MKIGDMPKRQQPNQIVKDLNPPLTNDSKHTHINIRSKTEFKRKNKFIILVDSFLFSLINSQRFKEGHVIFYIKSITVKHGIDL